MNSITSDISCYMLWYDFCKATTMIGIDIALVRFLAVIDGQALEHQISKATASPAANGVVDHALKHCSCASSARGVGIGSIEREVVNL